MVLEKTLVLLKPDAVQRNLTGKIITRFEEKGLKIVAMKLMQLDDKMLEIHYGKYKDKPFFPRIRNFMKSAPIVAMVLEGKNATKVTRTITGLTEGSEAAPGTIRGDFAIIKTCNLIHASDPEENPQEEINRFFKPNEILSWKSITEKEHYFDDEL